MPPPLSCQDCLINGEVDSRRHITYRRRLDKLLEFTQNYHCVKRNRSSSADKHSPRRKRTSSAKQHELLVRDNNGDIREMLHADNLWHLLRSAIPPRNKSLHKQFRVILRMLCDYFLSLSHYIEHHDSFIRLLSNDCCG